MLRLGITAESHGDAELVSGVGDAVAIETADWLEGQPEAFRAWRGLGDEAFLDIHAATKLARERGVRILGHFQDGPGKLDAQLYRNVFALFADEEVAGVVVVAHDTDEEPERIEAFKQAAGDRHWGFAAVHACAHPEIEAWLLAAFIPQDEDERAALAALKQELGFDPTLEADQLKAGVETAKRNAKRILAILCDHHEARERLLATALDVLRERGVPSRLTAFLTDFRAAIAPHLGAGPA